MKKISFIIFLLTILAVSCEKDEWLTEEHYFIVNDGASMPVYLRGNLDSDVIILFLHGGPGGNASMASFLPAFKDLENAYTLAYWDQRGSGLSQGNPDISTFTMEQFVEDTDYIIQSLQERYPGKKLFLFGHSWGGALGSAYLSTETYQSKINGFICMNSGHNLEAGLPLSVSWVGDFAAEQISANHQVEFWTEVRDWCAMNPDMTNPDNYFKYVEYLQETDAYRHNNQEVNTGKVTLNDILNSRMSLAVFVGGAYLSQNFNILELNLSDEMGSIHIPSLVIWGIHDGVNTLEMGYNAFESLGTNPSMKEMVLLNNSAHEGYLEEPELFKEAFSEFVEAYK